MNTSQNPVTTALPTAGNGKIVSAREAVRLIRDGDTVATGIAGSLAARGDHRVDQTNPVA